MGQEDDVDVGGQGVGLGPGALERGPPDERRPAGHDVVDPLAVVGRDDPVADSDVGTDVADPPDVVRIGRVGAREDRAPTAVEAGDAPRRTGCPEVLPVLLEHVVPPQGTQLGGVDHVISLPPRQTISSTNPHASAVAPSMTTPLRPSAAAR